MKMISIGLMPSSTGDPGGQIVGQHMGDYIIEGGKFLDSFHQLEKEESFQLAWVDRKALPRLFNPIIADPNEITRDNSKSINSALMRLDEEGVEISEITDTPVYPHHIQAGTSMLSELLPENFVEYEAPKRKTRHRYVCNGCQSKVYGKPHLNIRCEDCNKAFECEEI